MSLPSCNACTLRVHMRTYSCANLSMLSMHSTNYRNISTVLQDTLCVAIHILKCGGEGCSCGGEGMSVRRRGMSVRRRRCPCGGEAVRGEECCAPLSLVDIASGWCRRWRVARSVYDAHCGFYVVGVRKREMSVWRRGMFVMFSRDFVYLQTLTFSHTH